MDHSVGTVSDVITGGLEGAVSTWSVKTMLESLTDHFQLMKRKMILVLEGSELTKMIGISQLYDEYEHFRQIKGEGIQGYYVRFTKLINDMRNIKMTMSRM
ncbi:hypothetical protein Tco_1440496 [Tanacetum coccineum]